MKRQTQAKEKLIQQEEANDIIDNFGEISLYDFLQQVKGLNLHVTFNGNAIHIHRKDADNVLLCIEESPKNTVTVNREDGVMLNFLVSTENEFSTNIHGQDYTVKVYAPLTKFNGVLLLQ